MQQPKELHPWTVSCSSRVLNNAPLKEHWIFDGPTSEVRRGTKSKALSGHHTRPKTTEDIKLMIKELMSQQIFHVKDVLQHSKFSNLHHSFTKSTETKLSHGYMKHLNTYYSINRKICFCIWTYYIYCTDTHLHIRHSMYTSEWYYLHCLLLRTSCKCKVFCTLLYLACIISFLQQHVG